SGLATPVAADREERARRAEPSNNKEGLDLIMRDAWVKIYFASVYFDPNNETQKILRGSIKGNDVARKQKKMWESVAADITSQFGVKYTPTKLKAMKEEMTRVVGRVAASHRQRLHAVPTGGGEPRDPSDDPQPCEELWLKAVEHHIFATPRFVGMGEDLEAGVRAEDGFAVPLSYKELTRLSRGSGGKATKRMREETGMSRASQPPLFRMSTTPRADFLPHEKYELVRAHKTWSKETAGLQKRFTTLKAFADHFKLLGSQGKIQVRNDIKEQHIVNFIKNWKSRGEPTAEEVRAKAEKELLAKEKKKSAKNSTDDGLPSDAVNAALSAMAEIVSTEEAEPSGARAPADTFTAPAPLSNTRKRTYAETVEAVARAAEAVERYYTFKYKRATKTQRVGEACDDGQTGDTQSEIAASALEAYIPHSEGAAE
ncbi:hypothetical protein FOZ62_029160, partial [Perkinsus olseni]